jgi:carbon-monoxide dehydrogenase medium subunit
VVPALGRGERTARRVVDLRRAGLGGIEAAGDTVRIGACATYTDLLASPVVAPLLRLMATGVTGGPQILGRGTVGGSVAAARPSSDVPAALAVLDAVAEIAGPAGTRRVPVTDLWTGAYTTALAPGEVLVACEVPVLQAGTGCGYIKLKHSTSSWPIVTAAATVTRDARAALVIGGASPTPARIHLTADGLDNRALRTAVDEALSEVWADELAPAAYRAAVAPVAAHRALTQARAAALPGAR